MKTLLCPFCGAALDLASIKCKGADICDFCGAEVVADSRLSDEFDRNSEQFRQTLIRFEENIAANEAFLLNNKKKYDKSKASGAIFAVMMVVLIILTCIFTATVIFENVIVLIFAVPSAILLALNIRKLKQIKAFKKTYENAELNVKQAKAVYEVKKSEYESSWVLK